MGLEREREGVGQAPRRSKRCSTRPRNRQRAAMTRPARRGSPRDGDDSAPARLIADLALPLGRFRRPWSRPRPVGDPMIFALQLQRAPEFSQLNVPGGGARGGGSGVPSLAATQRETDLTRSCTPTLGLLFSLGLSPIRGYVQKLWRRRELLQLSGPGVRARGGGSGAPSLAAMQQN